MTSLSDAITNAQGLSAAAKSLLQSAISESPELAQQLTASLLGTGSQAPALSGFDGAQIQNAGANYNPTTHEIEIRVDGNGNLINQQDSSLGMINKVLRSLHFGRRAK